MSKLYYLQDVNVLYPVQDNLLIQTPGMGSFSCECCQVYIKGTICIYVCVCVCVCMCVTE